MIYVSGNINAQPRKVSCRLVIGGNTITNVKRLTYSSDWSGNVTIGQAVSSYITATIPATNYNLTSANVAHSMSVCGLAGNLFVGTLDKCNINSANKIAYESNRTWRLEIAPVVQGKEYYTTDGKLYGFFSTYPEIGSTTVGNRYNTEIGSFTAPITGYVAIRYPASVSNAVLNAWDKIGEYTVDHNSIKIKQGYTTFTAHDKLYNNNTYTARSQYADTVQGLCNDVCSQLGINTITNLGNIGSITVDKASLNGYTLRDIIGFVAAVCGTNAYVDANNNLVLKWFDSTSYTADGTRANIPYVGESDCTVSRLICQGADGVYTYGSGEGIYFTCPIVNESNQSTILSYLHGILGITYRKADIDIPYGNYGLQSGDIITVTTTGESLIIPIMSNSWTFDGGLSSSVSSHGLSDYTGTANNAAHSVSDRKVQERIETQRRINKEIADASALITGATGGYIKILFGTNQTTGEPETAAIYIMDEPDIDSSNNVWIFNQNGLGHMFRNPNTGQFENVNVALTKYGTVVAERIAGTKISGVAIESTEETTNAAQVYISGGAVELNQLYNNVVTAIGRIRSRLRTSPDTVNTLAIECEQGFNITLGKTGSPKLVYISDPQGGDTFRIYENVRFFDEVYMGSGNNAYTISSLKSTVDSIYNEIYDPNNGILARLDRLENQ